MPTLPLTYCSQPCGFALVDPGLLDLAELPWTLSMPESQRRKFRNRPDVALAALREDPLLMSKCHPILIMRNGKSNTSVRLSHIALRPAMVELLLRHTFRAEPLLDELAQAHADISRVVFVNRNRCDCRLENLREVVNVEEFEP